MYAIACPSSDLLIVGGRFWAVNGVAVTLESVTKCLGPMFGAVLFAASLQAWGRDGRGAVFFGMAVLHDDMPRCHLPMRLCRLEWLHLGCWGLIQDPRSLLRSSLVSESKASWQTERKSSS